MTRLCNSFHQVAKKVLLGLTVTSIDGFYDMLSTWGILLPLKWKKCVCKCNAKIVKYYTKKRFHIYCEAYNIFIKWFSQ
jgi:hypothetical protein